MKNLLAVFVLIFPLTGLSGGIMCPPSVECKSDDLSSCIQKNSSSFIANISPEGNQYPREGVHLLSGVLINDTGHTKCVYGGTGHKNFLLYYHIEGVYSAKKTLKLNSKFNSIKTPYGTWIYCANPKGNTLTCMFSD